MIDKSEELRALRVRESNRIVSTPLTKHLRVRIEEFWEHAKDCLAGGGSRRRTLAIIGESGTGKSTAVKHVLNSFDEFKPYKNEHNETIIPMLSIEVEYTNTPKDLAIRILRKVGADADYSSNETALYEELKNQLRASGTIFLHLDEAQHLKKGGSSKAVMGLKDRFKSFLVIENWPLHLILSGVEDLSELFTGDQQMPNRSNVMRFDTLSAPADNKLVLDILTDIASCCSLQIDKALMTTDFLGRLVKATGGGIGTLIEMVRAACFKALSKGHSAVTARDFEFVYSRNSGSLPADNIITAAAWVDLDRSNALIDLVPKPVEPKRSRKKASK
ncbi:ATP-binding protein [Ensifer sesbaniae]|uniref:AAA family ATPase n=1 Tax=Ensifer sesbaniae TaxID=1214071 RepID=UPI00200132F4|nr:ATP-binding protein [Ensifer sesbaniae]